MNTHVEIKYLIYVLKNSLCSPKISVEPVLRAPDSGPFSVPEPGSLFWLTPVSDVSPTGFLPVLHVFNLLTLAQKPVLPGFRTGFFNTQDLVSGFFFNPESGMLMPGTGSFGLPG